MITFFGDVYLADEDPDFSVDVSEFDSENNIYIFNFEYAYYDKEYPHALNKALLRSSKDIRNTFDRLPFAVDVNNNHIFDYGEPGLQNTLDYLDSIGIKYFGSGTIDSNCNNPLIININGKKIALLGYYHRDRDRDSQNNNYLRQSFFSEETFIKDVALAKEKGGDLIIPSIHWGVEHSPGFSKKQQQAAHFMIDNGADLIIGHHPHCIQPYEIYKDKYIFYSLGNFVFDEIYTKSWYKDEQTSECMHCKRWHKWSRESLGVSFNEKTKDIIVRKYIQRKHTIKKVDLSSDKILKQYENVKFIKQRTFLRKLKLAFSCFFMFKGHFFYWKGFFQMVRLFYNMHLKRGSKKGYPE